MEVKGSKIILNRSEVSEVCPTVISWAAKMIQIYGPDTDFKGRLKVFSRCPEVLKAAGYDVEISEETAGEKARRK
jgi:hypothetical protein